MYVAARPNPKEIKSSLANHCFAGGELFSEREGKLVVEGFVPDDLISAAWSAGAAGTNAGERLKLQKRGFVC